MIPATGTMPLRPVGLRLFENLANLQRAIAEKIRSGELRHRAHAGDGVDLAVLRADQNWRLPAPTDVRILGGGGGEDARDSGVHGVAARISMRIPAPVA